MIIYKESYYELHITPMENGKCEYMVDCHDFGNLESLMGRKLNYVQLNYWIKNISKYISENKYN